MIGNLDGRYCLIYLEMDAWALEPHTYLCKCKYLLNYLLITFMIKNCTVQSYQYFPVILDFQFMKYLQVKDMKKLDFKLCDNLRKVTICSNFSTGQLMVPNSLPNWIRIFKISINPKTSKYDQWFSLENASHIICIFDEKYSNGPFDFSCIERMKNLETIQFEISRNCSEALDEKNQVLPLFTKLKSCSKVLSLILNFWSYPSGMYNIY